MGSPRLLRLRSGRLHNPHIRYRPVADPNRTATSAAASEQPSAASSAAAWVRAKAAETAKAMGAATARWWAEAMVAASGTSLGPSESDIEHTSGSIFGPFRSRLAPSICSSNRRL